MAVSKTIALQGGFDAAAYLIIRSAVLDRVTGEVDVVIWSFRDEASRRKYSAALDNLAAARTAANAPYDPMSDEERSKLSLLRMRMVRAAEENLQDCNPGILYGNLKMTPEAAAPAIKDGVVDIAALYGLATKQGGPLFGGKEC